MHFSVALFSFIAIMATIGISDSAKAKVQTVCPTKPSVVWATDGNFCYPMRNSCYFDNENLARTSRSERPLTKTSKLRCKSLCNSLCMTQSAPVCAELNGKYTVFDSECILTNHVCNTGETFIKTDPEKCNLSPFSYVTINLN